MMEVLPVGIHSVAADRYHADPAEEPSLSSSMVKLLTDQTPLHAWNAHPRLNPNHERVERDIFDLGNVAHQLVLEKSTERVQIVEANDWRTNAAKDARKQARAEGKIPLLEKDFARVEQMVMAILERLADRTDDPPLFTAGKCEQTLLWHEPRGVLCRALVDWLHDDRGTIDDLKTTGTTANPVVWSKRVMWSIGGDVQAAMNIRGLQALTGKVPTFRFVVVENTPPYALSVVTLSESALALANEKINRAIDKWAECLASSRWPGYTGNGYEAEPQPWAEWDLMQKDAEAATA